MYHDLFFLTLLAIVFVVANYIIHKYIIFFALKKEIKPYLKSKNLTFIRVKSVGLFNSGDFPKKKLHPFVPKFGNIINETLVYVYARTPEKNEIRFTAKIITAFFIVKNVEYKGL